jgi:hypothetical protein
VSPAKPRKIPPQRYRLTVPVADEAVNRWLEMQDNASASVRMVIREYIERNGYNDATCGPVDQQPKRGRPVGSGSTQRFDTERDVDESDEGTDEIDFNQAVAGLEPPVAAAKEPLGIQMAKASGRAAEGLAQAKQAAQEAKAATTQPAVSAGDEDLHDMDDIFSTGRNR